MPDVTKPTQAGSGADAMTPQGLTDLELAWSMCLQSTNSCLLGFHCMRNVTKQLQAGSGADVMTLQALTAWSMCL